MPAPRPGAVPPPAWPGEAGAEREGFEPSRGLNTPYSLSRRAPSTSRPPLLVTAVGAAGRRREWDSNPRDPTWAQQFSRLPPSAARPSLLGAAGGGGGIRTHGTGNPVQQFSRLPPSAARPPLPGHTAVRVVGLYRGRNRRSRSQFRFSEKKCSSREPHSASATPETRSHRWFRRSSCGML
jgi:hypothetical protein